MKHFQILGTLRTAATLLFSVFFIFSCTKQGNDTVSVSLKKPIVEAKAGQQLLTITATGDWTISLDTGDQSGEVDWVWFEDWTSGEQVITINKEQAAGKPVTLNYANNKDTKDRSCTIIATCPGGARSTCILTQGRSAQQEQTPETIKSDPEPDMWLELPAMKEGDGRYFITHEMKLGNTYFRNYSLYMSEKDIVAHWVAYPLNSWTISSGSGRSDEWGLDPKIPRKNQPVIFSAFSNSGTYARGHQCPSADRYAPGANEQTFYGSNMTPQMHRLNSNAWAALEGHVRSKCRQFDTLYVVTGCLTKGSTQTCRDNDGKNITVPVGYYKALLGFKTSKTSDKSVSGGTGGYKGYYTAIGYYYDHRDYGQYASVNAQAMTIDELENKVGEDFFPRLEKVLGAEKAAQVESQKDSYWNQ